MHLVVTGGAGFIGSHLTIYGNGHQTRDFIHVEDVAIAFEKALTVSLQHGKYLVCNIGTGKSISLIELVEICRSNFPNWNQVIYFNPSRSGEILNSQADVSNAAQYLSFSAQKNIHRDLLS